MVQPGLTITPDLFKMLMEIQRRQKNLYFEAVVRLQDVN
jgi:hypothetical protein